MFTGLVAGRGRVTAVGRSDDGVRLTVQTALASELALGDSVAVNGVCLTAVAIDAATFDADVMNETLGRSSLGDAAVGSDVNLELAAPRIGPARRARRPGPRRRPRRGLGRDRRRVRATDPDRGPA